MEQDDLTKMDILKRIPLIYYPLRTIYRSMRSMLYFRNLYHDPKTVTPYGQWYRAIKDNQIDKKVSLFRDRQEEIKQFFGVTDWKLIKYFIKHGFPNSERFLNNIGNIFEKSKKTDEQLKNAYQKSSYIFSIRMMLGYERYNLILPFMDTIMDTLKKKPRDLKVLDYGCGVGDIGLLFSQLGCDVTIVDLDQERYDFTISRFLRRGYNPEIIRVMNANEYPELPKDEYDIVIATEIFEHVREPFILLRNITNSLKKFGFMLDTLEGIFDRHAVCDHLQEAIEIGNTKEYFKYYHTHFINVPVKGTLPRLFRKVG